MKNIRVARRYAMGLMAAAVEEGTVEQTGADVELIGRVLESSREFRRLVASPVVSTAKKSDVLRSVFSGLVAPSTLAFILLMTEKHREDILPDMVVQFKVLLDRRLGVENVDVTSAVELSKEQQDAVGSRLQTYTGKKVCLRFAIDPAIRGGLVVRVADTVLDGSLRRQLELLRGRLAAGEPVNQ